jgi:hypothetical protein
MAKKLREQPDDMNVAELFADLLGAYAALGILFAIAFVVSGIGRIDSIAKNSTVGFRLIVLPGSALLWLLLLRRWVGKGRRQ